MPAVASWNAAMPPAAPEPTMMTSYCADPGLIEAAALREASICSATTCCWRSGCCIVISPRTPYLPGS